MKNNHAMTISDLLQPNTRIFLKSEWGPASEDWPAVSFSKHAVGRRIRSMYTPGRDYIIYVGTTNPANTPNPSHRSRLLSVTSIDHRTEHPTWRLVPQASWEEAQQEHANRWHYSFSITDAWDITNLPTAHDLVPRAYRSLGHHENFGSIVELDKNEIAAISNEPITLVPLKKQPAATKADARTRYINADKTLKEEIFRMATRIAQRVEASSTTTSRHNPEREANPPYETQQLLYDLWEEQQGHCGLCQQPIPLPPTTPLLRASPDRKDSSNLHYDKGNTHVTHLGCNLAKNQYSIDDYDDWRDTITGNIHQQPRTPTDDEAHAVTAAMQQTELTK